MKLKYKHQRFQADAAKSVTDIFTGQQYCDSADFLIDQGKNKGVFDLTGFGNQKLMLDLGVNYGESETNSDELGT